MDTYLIRKLYVKKEYRKLQQYILEQLGHPEKEMLDNIPNPELIYNFVWDYLEAQDFISKLPESDYEINFSNAEMAKLGPNPVFIKEKSLFVSDFNSYEIKILQKKDTNNISISVTCRGAVSGYNFINNCRMLEAYFYAKYKQDKIQHVQENVCNDISLAEQEDNTNFSDEEVVKDFIHCSAIESQEDPKQFEHMYYFKGEK